MQPIYTKNRTIGLLGGSFNPAHEGHLHLSLEAIKRLKLDQVWWLVSPGNPLKSAAEMMPYKKRLQSAEEIAAQHPKIQVSDIETRLGTRFSIDTVTGLQRRFPEAHFLWLMGADNLAQLHRWRRWREFCDKIPIIIFDRAPYSHTAQRSKAYVHMQKFLLKDNMIGEEIAAPALAFIPMRKSPLSSTALRKRLEKRRK